MDYKKPRVVTLWKTRKTFHMSQRMEWNWWWTVRNFLGMEGLCFYGNRKYIWYKISNIFDIFDIRIDIINISDWIIGVIHNLIYKHIYSYIHLTFISFHFVSLAPTWSHFRCIKLQLQHFWAAKLREKKTPQSLSFFWAGWTCINTIW